MPRRRKALLLLALGLFACGLLVVLTREKEPTYDDQSLSEWVAMYRVGVVDPFTEIDKKSSAAVQHIGAKALPFLLAWIDYEPAKWPAKIESVSNKLPSWFGQHLPTQWRQSPDEAEQQAHKAVRAFLALGQVAAPAIPELTRRINRTNEPYRANLAMLALAGIGQEAIPTLTNVLSRPDQADSPWARACMIIMGTNALPMIPLLVQRLQDTQNTKWMVVIMSAGILGNLKLQPDIVVPALIRGLTNSGVHLRMQAPYALAEFGELARPALPALSNALSDPNPSVRDNASNAIWRITTAEATNAPAR